MTDRPLLAVVMIVKNEARGIRATLESVKPFVDRWTLVDTGSTDGTQAIIREVMAGTPGDLFEEPFVDFGTTRNLALDRAGTRAVFTLMLSGDETLVGGPALRRFCEARREDKDGAYHMRVHFGDIFYDSARLARADAGWRYEGVTHEVLTKPGVLPPTVRVSGAHIIHDVSHRNPKAQGTRWRLDLELLQAAARKSPKDTRTVFYLAQTHECLGHHKAALDTYERRARMGGWVEEVYESLYRIGRVSEALKRPWSEVQQRYLDAHAQSPHRAEPLYAIANHWYAQKCWPLVYLFASRGAALPYPEQATLFVDADVYSHKLLDLVGASAYYVGEYEAGEAALEKLLTRSPDDVRLQENLLFYARRRGELRVTKA
jgi:hypothetical protein